MHFPQFLIIWICMQALHLTVSFCVFCDFYLDQGVCGFVVCVGNCFTAHFSFAASKFDA
ncbi:hypothetical protein GYH30_015670 [Glycine max]|nr:hypothetical protein GYH30_015670 [Glycine max]